MNDIRVIETAKGRFMLVFNAWGKTRSLDILREEECEDRYGYHRKFLPVDEKSGYSTRQAGRMLNFASRAEVKYRIPNLFEIVDAWLETAKKVCA